MKRKLAVFGLVLALFAGVITEEKARANTSFGFNLFYSDLAPYGNWMQYQDYGYAWSPGQVGAGWQPYVDGQWVWSDQGWTWASYEPWGWATYHYGRWVFDPYYGWLWLPGTTWAPAWVSWYQSPGYVGWSPLPPDNNFFLEIGLSFVNYGGGYYNYGYNDYGYGYYDYDYYDYGYKHKNKHRHHKKGKYYDNDYYADGDHCVFVPEDKFGRENAKIVAVTGDEKNLVALRNAKNVTDIKVDNDRVYNYGPDKGRIDRAADSKVKQVSLADSDLTTLRNGKQNQKLNDDVYRVYRPKIEKKEGENPFTAKDLDRGAVKSPSAMSRSNLNGSGDSNGRDMRPQGLTPNGSQRDTLVQDRGKPIDQRDLYGNSGQEEYGVIRNNNSMQRRNPDENLNEERPFTNGRDRQPRNGDLKAGTDPDGLRRSGPVEAMNVNPGQASRQQRNPYYPGAVNNSMNQSVNRNNRAVQMPRAPQERQSMNRPPDNYRPRNNVRMPEMRQAPSPAKGNMNAVSRPPQPDRNREQRARSINNYSQPQPQYRPERSTRNNNSRGESRSRNTSYSNNRNSSPRQSIRSDSPSMRSSNPGSTRSFNGSSTLRSRSR